MTDQRPKIRLFVDAPLNAGQTLSLSRDHSHYLFNVMRQSAGADVAVFNGRDGEWAAKITDINKRQANLTCVRQSAQQRNPPDLWLLFAPIKKARTDFIVEKAAELGAAVIQPIFTRFTNSERLRPDRLAAHAIEAAEQCGGTFVPDVRDPRKLDALLDDWPEDRQILFCDEALTALPVQTALSKATPGPWAILIGPEGGFETAEAARLRQMPQTLPVTLGPRILRADTAAVAAIAAWQQVLGDWA